MGLSRMYLLFLILLPLADATATSRIDSIYHLPTVEIVAKQRPFEAVIPSQILSEKRLLELNSHSVADAIRYFSGVQIKDYGGVGGVKTVDIRSMGTNHMGVFYDGIQLGNAQNGQIDLGKYSLDNIESISLYNGQKSDIFQSAKDYGSAGTIYLQTRRPRFLQNKRDNARFIFRTGSFGLINPSILWEHKFSSSISGSVNLEYTYASGKYKFRYHKMFSDGTTAWDTTATRQNGGIKAFRAEVGLFGTIAQGQWNWKAYYYDSNRGIPGAIVNNVWKNSQKQWDRNFFTQGTFQKRFTDSYELKVNAKYAHDFMHYLNPDTTMRYTDNKFWQQELYVSAANRYTILPAWDLNLAVDYQWNTLDATLAQFSYPSRNTILAALASSYRWNGFSAQGSLLGSFINDKSSLELSEGNHLRRTQWNHYFTPALFLAYQPWKEHELNIRAFYKRIFRMPTFNDLYYTDIGNANLKPEYATQYNIGAEYKVNVGNSSIGLSADAYYNLVDDKIIAVPKGNSQYRWMMMNIGKVRIKGLDITASAAMALPYSINLDTHLSYTYQTALDYSAPSDIGDGGTYKGMIPYIPRHSGSASVHAAWKSLDLNYSFIYIGERYDNSSNIIENYVQPWYTHDISLSYGLKYEKLSYNLSVEINNLLNQQYEVIRNYPMPGRNFKFILKIDI